MRAPWPMVALSLAACAGEAAPLTIAAPTRIRGLLGEANVCAALVAELTFDRTDDLDGPPLDRVRLVATDADPCTFRLAEEAELRRGRYDLLVRFTTFAPPATCPAPVLVGAYVRRGLDFPFTSDFTGLGEGDFASRPGDEPRLGEGDFDLDDDGLDNLAELRLGSNPCRPSSRPVVAFAADGPADEGGALGLRLVSADEDGVPHRVVATITQPHGPTAGTETVTVTAWTDGRAAPTVSPAPPPGERWTLGLGQDLDPGPGAGEWRLTLRPDEPFTGALALAASADDGGGTRLATAADAVAIVNPIDDPTELWVDGGERPTRRFRFAEAAEPPTEARFRFTDLDLESAPGAWRVELLTATVGVELRRDGERHVLRFAPTNAQALAEPPGGYPATLGFFDPSGAQVSTATIALEVFPRRNDPLAFSPPAIGELGLPDTPFPIHVVRFELFDPDEVDDAPTCTAVVRPAGATTCPRPFAAVRCEPRAPRDGGRWPFRLALEPAADYFAACGARPEFSVELTIEDVPPIGADNGPSVLATTTCPGDGPCHLALRTATVVDGAEVSGGPAAPAALSIEKPAVIHGGGGLDLALVESEDVTTGEPASYLVDLSYPAPSFVHRFTPSELCTIDLGFPGHKGVADEVHHRIAVHGRPLDGTSCASAKGGLYVVDLAARAVAFHDRQLLCGTNSSSALGNPAVDPDGNLWVPCAVEPGRLTRIDAQGARTTATVAEYQAWDNFENDVLTAEDGTPYYVWFDERGVLVLELGGFPSVNVTRFDLGASWWRGEVEDHVVDAERRSLVFAVHPYQANAQLYRIHFRLGAPALEGPLDLGDIGGASGNGNSSMRLLLRDSAGEAPGPEVDLVVQPGSSGDPRPHVDLDAFAVVGTRPAPDYYLGFSPGLFPSPDRRFYFAPTAASHRENDAGVYLFPWDPAEPRRFRALPAPGSGIDTDRWWKTVVSDRAHVALVSEGDRLSALFFLDSRFGRD